MNARMKYFKNKKQKVDYVTKILDTYYQSVMQPQFVTNLEIKLIRKNQ